MTLRTVLLMHLGYPRYNDARKNGRTLKYYVHGRRAERLEEVERTKQHLVAFGYPNIPVNLSPNGDRILVQVPNNYKEV